MTNIAADWPGMPDDMTSPAEIAAEARRIAEANKTERRALSEAIKAAHSAHVWSLIRSQAIQIIQGRQS